MHRISETIERKFVDSIDICDYEIWTDTGWEEITSIHKTVEYVEWVLELDNGMELICADDHIVFDYNMNEIFVKDLNVGDHIMTESGPIMVTSVFETDKSSNMFDVTVNSPNHRLYTNGILSHNTTTATCVILHYILFNESKTVGLLSNKADSAREIMDRIQLAYQNLPKWLQQGVVEWNKGSMKLENGCKVIAASSSASSIRGKSVSFLYIDEMAFIEGWEEFYSSVYPTVTSGKETKILFTSTPKGLNHFYKFCNDAMQPDDEDAPFQVGVDAGKNGFVYHEIPWNRVPGRDDDWKRITLAGIGDNVDQFEQEYNCVSGDTIIELLDTKTNKEIKMKIEDFSELLSREKTYVYKLINNQGLPYIGITIDFKKRFKAHLKSKRFGGEIFDYEILEVLDTYEEAMEREEFYISQFDSFHNGLNKSVNGKGNHLSDKFTTKGYKFSEESKKKMSISGKKRHEKFQHPLKGVGHSTQSKEKMSEFRKGKFNRNRIIDNATANNIINSFENETLSFDFDFMCKNTKEKDRHKIGKVPYTELKNKGGFNLTYKFLLCKYYAEMFGVTPNAIRNVLHTGRDYANTKEYK